ncbi:MAG: peptidase domain-containing ABC transporter [Aeriscardovia sp.]|nr:peptidase domain-containing ABC transporter [Aeriscardovia sp.]
MLFKRYYCIRQQEQKDCGCACLATIFKQFGLRIPIYKIRDLAKTDLYGTSVYGLTMAAEKLGCSTKAFMFDDKEQLLTNKDIPLPAIAHVILDKRYQHFVVIQKIDKNSLLIADPAQGMRKMTPEEFFKIWTGVLLLVTKKTPFETEPPKNGLARQFLQLISPHKALLINIFLSSILITALGIVSSFYFQFLLDTVIPNDLKSTLTVFSTGLLVIVLFNSLAKAFRQQIFLHFSQKLDVSLMLNYYNRLMGLPMEFFQSRPTGDVISRLDDVYKIRNAISGATLTILLDGFMAIVGGITLFCESRYLFLITLAPLAAYLIIVFAFNRLIEKRNHELMQSQAKVTAYLVECLTGIETIKSYTAESNVKANIERKFIEFVKGIFNLGFVNNIQNSLKLTVKAVFGIVILWIGTVQVLDGKIPVGLLLTFNALLAYFLTPIENIVSFQATFQSAKVAAKRLEEITGTPLEKEIGGGEKDKLQPTSLEGDIEFQNASFRYGARKETLRNISLTIKSGSKTALVGRSGSGKTTLAKLLMNFYPLESGQILIDGVNIGDIALDSLRSRIAYVSQDDFLFNDTLLENLRFANPMAKYEEIIEACKKARIHDYITSLPLRYNTLVEENGTNLSSGQKQRLALAKAILKKPDIFILDEATSNLDAKTEKEVMAAIREAVEGKTCIFIAHRLSTISECSQVVVMEDGKIEECGTKEELIGAGGGFSQLWQEYCAEFEA